MTQQPKLPVKDKTSGIALRPVTQLATLGMLVAGTGTLGWLIGRYYFTSNSIGILGFFAALVMIGAFACAIWSRFGELSLQKRLRLLVPFLLFLIMLLSIWMGSEWKQPESDIVRFCGLGITALTSFGGAFLASLICAFLFRVFMALDAPVIEEEDEPVTPDSAPPGS
jgi:hypothetical protein